MTARSRLRPAAITFDFGNTLVVVTRERLESVVERMADAVAEPIAVDRAAFLDAWRDERERQFREEIPAGREVVLDVRVRRVLARVRGQPVPPPSERWDDERATGWSTPAEQALVIDAYAAAFVAEIEPPPAVGPLLARLAATHVLAIVSNWPHAGTLDRFVDAAGWRPYLRAVVVSERVGAIKPAAEMFRAAETALGIPPRAILHVGDDWAADVVGAKRAGWLAAYLVDRQAESPFPSSAPDSAVVPDLVLDELDELLVHVG